jgi:hypothetical protein
MQAQGTDVTFLSGLATVRRRRRAGLVVCELMRLAGATTVVLLVAGLLDVWLAPDTVVRSVVGVGVLCLCVGLTLAWLGDAYRFSAADAARFADRALGNRRRETLSALELSTAAASVPRAGEADEARELYRFLVERAVTAAGARLCDLRTRDLLPRPELRRQACVLLVQLLALAAAVGLRPDAAALVAERLACPWRDLPPYSRYRFRIEPGRPQVLYDGTLELRLGLEGPPVRRPVWLQTRHEGTVRRVACFQEGTGRYSQRLEKVTVPLEFSFRVGRARSPWQRVEVLLQPQIALAEVTLTPPAYSRLAPRRFAAGTEDVRALAGSSITLTVTSNRPLLDGTAVLRVDGARDATALATGRPSGPRTVGFDWRLACRGTVEVVVRDLQGTACRQPLRLRQALVPDVPPEVTLTEPGEYVLATATATVPLAGRAEDDLGLKRVEWVRTVVGYRDRAALIGPQTVTRALELQEPLDLAGLGVQPGQVLEIYAEARDTNPALTGVGTSSVCRVQVISTDDYKAMVRARTTLAEFSARFREVSERLQAVRQALEALHRAAAGEADAPTRAEALATARDAVRTAAREFRRLAADFAAFELEEKLVPVLEKAAGQLERQAEKLDGATADAPGLEALAAALAAELSPASAEADRLALDADTLAQLATIMGGVTRFREIVRRQTEIAGRLRRYSNLDRVPETEAGALETLIRAQLDNQQALGTLLTDMRSWVEQVPAEFPELAASLQQFANRVEALQVLAAMEAAAAAADARRGVEAHRAAQLALERLQQLLTEPGNGHDGNAGPFRFNVPANLTQTLAQLLAAMGQQLGGGMGAAAGLLGAGAAGDAGSLSPAQSLLNVRTFGPTRLSAAADTQARGRGRGRGGAGPGSAVAAEPEAAATAPTGPARGEVLPWEQVPPRYADAVRRYFAAGP